MYLDRSYTPRRRRKSRFRWWPIFLVAIIGIVLYEQQPEWMNTRPIGPTPVPTRAAISFLSEADVLIRASDFEAALKAYDEVIRLEPTSAEPLIAQAELHMILQQIPEARQVAEAAVALEPENPYALAALARALDWQGQYEAAIQYGFDGLEVDPENATVLAVLGEVYSDVRNWPVAEGHLQNAYEIDPENILVLRNLAYLEETRGEYTKAIEYYNQAIALAPHRYDLYIERGRQESVGLNDYAAALASYEKASTIFESSVTLDAYGFGLYNMGDNFQAVRVLRKAVEMNPDYGLAQTHLGMVYYALRNFEDAVPALELGIELMGDFARVEHIYSLGLAHIYRAPFENDNGEIIETPAEKCELARGWLQKALEIEPGAGPALEGLSLCNGV